ncbi:MAG: Ribose ABC transport system, permease protein RbsC [Anaerolineae bacterium]|jgi:ribose transport system permease protein|nr:MAG: Ribose ABC transport system, permease protein RbsC [Anaerolineae bacterium]
MEAFSFPKRVRLDTLRDYGTIIAFVALFVVLSFTTPAFLSLRNLHNILDQSAHVGIIACAMTIVIIGGCFDLSVGAIFAFAGSLAAIIARAGYTELGILTGISVGLIFGLVNGIIITLFRINSFIATLATSLMIRGMALVLTGGLLIVVTDPKFALLGQGRFLQIKYPVYLFAGFALLTWFILSRTTFGRYVYAIGGNQEAARLSGVRVNLIRILTFCLTGLAAGIAGVLTVSRISQGVADIGAGVELDAIAATVIGGTSILGGEGAIWRTIVGVLLLRLIGNGFNLLNVPPFYQGIFQGAIIIFAVALDTLSKRNR